MKKLSFIYIILAGILWGTSGIFVHYLETYGFTSLQMTFVRAFVSFTSILIFALIRKKSVLKVNLRYVPLLVATGVALYFSASLYFRSIQLTSGATAVVLLYTSPIYVIIFSVLLLKEKLTKVKVFSLSAMLIGCFLVSGIIGGLKFNAVGILLGAFSGLSFAIYNIFTKISLKCGVNALSVTLYCFLFMSIVSSFSLQPKGFLQCISVSPAVVITLLLALGVLTSVIPYVLYTIGMKELDAGTVSALSIAEPASATLFSVIIFSEKLDLFGIIGILLILFAIFVIGKSEKE